MRSEYEIRTELRRRMAKMNSRDLNYGGYRANANFVRALMWVLGKDNVRRVWEKTASNLDAVAAEDAACKPGKD